MVDEFLDRLVGSWTLTGSIGSTQLKQKVDARWVIQGQFLEVHCLQEKPVPQDQVPYEAIYMLGYNNQSGEYSMHLFDTFGESYARMVGIGKRKDDSIEFLFEYPNSLFSNTFTWNGEAREWTMLLRQQEETGKWKIFATKTLMPMPQIRYPTVLFDWGDTVMNDDPASSVPMVEWETIEAVQGIESVLAYLQSSGRQIVLATSASISDEAQIWAALERASLDGYFSRIFCFKNTGLPKGKAFYRHILDTLGTPASDVLMVGDSFEKDVLDPNSLGIDAVWFNHESGVSQSSDRHETVHSMKELLSFFKSVEQ